MLVYRRRSTRSAIPKVAEAEAEAEAEATPPASSSAVSTDEQQHQPQQQERNPNSGFARLPKKTRDLPNLSECHNCGYRINTTNGRDKLQPLRSEWRIVLLCRKCARLVDSGEFCPFCFSRTSSEEEDRCFRCRVCSRRVHEHCVLKHRGFAPSNYYCLFSPGSGFTVCLDCWLPEPLLKLRSREGFKGGGRSRKVSKSGSGNGGPVVVEKDCGVKVLEVAVKDANSAMEKKVVAAANARELAATKAVVARKPVEDAVKDVNSAVEKKIAAAARARELAANKVVVARKAVEVANMAFDLVSKRDDSSENCTTSTAVDDAELAFQLHRELNSSRRISKNWCLMNSSCLAVPATMLCSGKSSVAAASEFSGDEENDKCNGGNCNVEEKSCSERLINSNGDDNSLETKSQSCGRGNENGYPNNIQSCSQTDGHTKTDRYYFKYSKRKSSTEATPRCTQSCGSEMHPNNIHSQLQLDCNMKTGLYYLKYSRRKSISKATLRCTQSCCGNEMHPNNIHSQLQSDCDMKTDLYCLKYSRRKSISKATLRYNQSCGVEMHPNNIRSQWLSDCDMNTDLYYLKYSRRNSSLKVTQRCRPKFLYEGSELETRTLGSGCLQNCSKKAKTFSDASFQSCAIPLQAYACASGSLRDQL